jgi:hypothetical protein
VTESYNVMYTALCYENSSQLWGVICNVERVCVGIVYCNVLLFLLQFIVYQFYILLSLNIIFY